ncbi:MAG: hypothetical protein MUP57_00170, partial [Clostridia bacterium]|nr:hypothetical protein [Clostridia bacterium]
MNISKKAGNIAISATLAIGERAREFVKLGKKFTSFAMGEPDFDTPDDVKQEAIRAIKDGFTKYTNTAGINELKEAISYKFKRDN